MKPIFSTSHSWWVTDWLSLPYCGGESSVQASFLIQSIIQPWASDLEWHIFLLYNTSSWLHKQLNFVVPQCCPLVAATRLCCSEPVYRKQEGRNWLRLQAQKWTGSKHLKTFALVLLRIYFYARTLVYLWVAQLLMCLVCAHSLRVSLFSPSGDVRPRHGVFRQNVWGSRGPPAHGVSWRTPQWTQHR